MTTKEKAKVYDLLLARAKRMFSEKELKYLFPELEENMDEKKTIDDFIEKACEWLKEQDEIIGISFREDFLKRFQDYIKGEYYNAMEIADICTIK